MLFAYFCDVWKLDEATIAWLGRLDPEVRATVMEEFDGSSLEELGDRMPVQVKPSDNIFVSGLPLDVKTGALKSLFERCGSVTQCRLLAPGTNALVRMASDGEAAIAVEDYNFRVPVDMTAALTVRFANKKEDVPPQTLDGAMLMGTVKVWHRDRGFGFIAINGCGPDVFVYRDAIVDARELDGGSTVVFQASWNQPKLQLITEKCIGTRGGVEKWLNATAGTARAVREYARTVMRRMERGPHDIRPRDDPEILAAEEAKQAAPGPVIISPVIISPPVPIRQTGAVVPPPVRPAPRPVPLPSAKPPG